MKKFTLFFVMVFCGASLMATNPTISTQWQLSAATSTLPSYVGTNNNCRGMAFGTFQSNPVLAVVSREGSNSVIILNATDGSQSATLNVTGIAGGTILINDAAITSDGTILVSNVATGTAGTFKVYQWSNTTDAPKVGISYLIPDASRYGDHITVTGSIADGSAKLYAASTTAVSGVTKILCWSMIPDVSNPGSYIFDSANPVNISTAITAVGGFASISFLPDGKFVHKSNGNQIKLVNADGTSTGDATPSSVVASAGNSVKYIGSVADTTYFAYFRYGSGQEKADVIKVVKGSLAGATFAGSTPVLGTNSNGNGAGRVAVDASGTDPYIYVLSTNNGIGKYKVVLPKVATGIYNAENENIHIAIADGYINITGTIASSIDVFNVIGQKIKTANNTNTIATPDKGIYIVQVKSNGKIIKNEKIFIR